MRNSPYFCLPSFLFPWMCSDDLVYPLLDMDTWHSVSRVTSEHNTVEPFPPLSEEDAEL